MSSPDTGISHQRAYLAQPARHYDLSRPPECTPVDEDAVRDYLRSIDEFQAYSKKAVVGLNIVIGGDVPVKTR